MIFTMVIQTENAKPHILIVDDDAEILSLLSRFLTKNDYRVTTARDGKSMKKALSDWCIDLIVLDLMMPGEDGLALCRQVRADSSVPVIMLTAMGEEVDRIIGLELGADDYMAKPFNPRELSARIKAVLRRFEGGVTITKSDGEIGRIYSFADFNVNSATRGFNKANEEIDLTAGEYDLLMAFVQNPQRVLNRDQLLDMAKGRAAIPFDRSIDVQVGRLRKKIEPNYKEPTLIKTVRGGGYMLTAKVTQT